MSELAFHERTDIIKYHADYLLEANSSETGSQEAGVTEVYNTYLLYITLIVMHAVTSRYDKTYCWHISTYNLTKVEVSRRAKSYERPNSTE